MKNPFRYKCRDRVRVKFPDLDRVQRDKASDLALDYFEKHPDATVEECAEALEESGNVLIAIAVLSLIVQVIYMLWCKKRDRRKRGDEE